VSSSAGYIFKNKAITTILTANVYRNNTQLTEEEIAKIGTINWYMDDGALPISTGLTLTVSTSTYVTKRSHKFIARLEEPDE
jgi:hypothetical protein